MATDLEKKICRQIEYYFGDINLPRDKFLQEKIKEDEGWISLEVLLTFKKLASLSTDQDVIANAVEKSEKKLVVVSEDKKKVRRNPDEPVPEFNDERKEELKTRTAYAKGFPTDEELNVIIDFLDAYGPIEGCIRRTTKDHKFKGSCFIIFKDIETCKKFVELESVKYKDTELIRKFQNDYHSDKKKEIDARKKSVKEKRANAIAEEKQIDFPKGAIIHFTGISEGQSITREEIKEKVKELGEIEVSYIDFNKGDLEGYLRFPTENNAVEFKKKIDADEFTVGEITLKIKCLEGEEEEEYLKKTSDNILKMRQKQKLSGKNNRKRKGNFNHGKDKRNRR